jgi:hypothetical protein
MMDNYPKELVQIQSGADLFFQKENDMINDDDDPTEIEMEASIPSLTYPLPQRILKKILKRNPLYEGIILKNQLEEVGPKMTISVPNLKLGRPELNEVET